MTAIIGPNGAGKSTLLKAALGIVTPLAGRATVYGQPLAQARDRIAYVPQRASVDWDFPTEVLDVVMMGLYRELGLLRRVRPRHVARAMECLARVGMQDFAERQIGQLSGGQQQMVSLARALLNDNRLLLVDEPTKGLAPRIVSEVAVALETMAEATPILLVEQNFSMARALGDHVAVMDDGKIVWTGAMATLAADAALQETLMGLSMEGGHG